MKTTRLLLLSLFVLISACASNYTTPPSGVNLVGINDSEISEIMAREPLAKFPARVAIARLQATNYSTLSNDSYGSGKYSLVSTRDVETDDSFEQMLKWHGLEAAAPIGRLLLPNSLNSMQEIRHGAAQLKADLVFVYTIDTNFHVAEKPLGPLSLISLGFLPNQKAHISSTVSGAVIDVRTGFVYGVSEANEKEQQRFSVWNTTNAVETARLRAEAKSFTSFMDESEKLWNNIVRQYAN